MRAGLDWRRNSNQRSDEDKLTNVALASYDWEEIYEMTDSHFVAVHSSGEPWSCAVQGLCCRPVPNAA